MPTCRYFVQVRALLDLDTFQRSSVHTTRMLKLCSLPTESLNLNRAKPAGAEDSAEPMPSLQPIAAKENSRPRHLNVSAPMPVAVNPAKDVKRSKHGKKAGGMDVIDTLDITGALYGAGTLYYNSRK